MSSEQLFANGRIAVLSNRLLGTDKLLRLAESKSVSEAFKVLGECGYDVSAADYETVLRNKTDALLAEVKELCCNASALNFLLCKFDFHNAKVLMKGKYMRQDFVGLCFANATYDPSQMNELFLNDDYSAFCRDMAEGCDAVDTQFANGNRSPQTVDMLLDKAYFAHLRRCSRKSASPLVGKLACLQIDAVNLSLIGRLQKANVEASDWFVEGGSVNVKTLCKLADGQANISDLPPHLHKLTATNEPESELARQRNDLIAQYADPLTLQPVLQYFFAKSDEIDLVRRIIVDVKSGVDSDKIKDKLNAK